MLPIMEELLAQSHFENLVEGKIIKGTITRSVKTKCLDIAPSRRHRPVHDSWTSASFSWHEIECSSKSFEDRDGNPIVFLRQGPAEEETGEHPFQESRKAASSRPREGQGEGGLIVNIAWTASCPLRRSTSSRRRTWT
jgi:hypothetical protein